MMVVMVLMMVMVMMLVMVMVTWWCDGDGDGCNGDTRAIHGDCIAQPSMLSCPSQPVGVAEVVGFKQHIVWIT